jgi:peptidoglycan/xylan/chitin deacetylase (PgdA/CDA1 family)
MYRFLRFPGGRFKAVTLSYDDGCSHDPRFLQTINRYGLRCTFNLNSDRLLAGQDLTVEQVHGLLADGHEVAVHGAHHLANGAVSPLDGIRDVLHCRETLEKTLGRIIRGMAYPDTGITRFENGTDYATVRAYLQNLGIVYARTLHGDNDRFELPTDWYAWMPTAHHNNPALKAYMDTFLALDEAKLYRSHYYPRLFYLWGHSYEFDRNQNWDLLDTIGQTLGGHDEIWYATNIEIY